MLQAQLFTSFAGRAVISGQDWLGRVHVRVLPITPAQFLKRQKRSKQVSIHQAFDVLDRFDRQFLETGVVPDANFLNESCLDDAMRDRLLDKFACFFTSNQYTMLEAGTKTLCEIARFNRSVLLARVAESALHAEGVAA